MLLTVMNKSKERPLLQLDVMGFAQLNPSYGFRGAPRSLSQTLRLSKGSLLHAFSEQHLEQRLDRVDADEVYAALAAAAFEVAF